MSKISSEEKLIAVKRHLFNHESILVIGESIGVVPTTILYWCRLYETGGDSAFAPRQYAKYSAELKTAAVEYYLSGKDSMDGTCKVFKIRSSTQLKNWIKRYNSHELKASPGGGIIMTKGRKTTFEERIEIVSECLKAGQNYEATAEKYQVSYQQVYQWVHKYKENGIEGLVDRRGRTKPVSEMSELEKIKAENKILRAQLERKELENIFLKKVDEIERRRS